ncbi:MAG: hypothetical protein DDT21_02742 [Syntrophomonadaceae bacterium]|nr:hypothetical protein [Bacillota bacterium]
MKKVLIGVIVGLLIGVVLTTAANGFAAVRIRLVINGIEIHPDVAPVMLRGRVMTPARFVAEALGATVQWEEATRTVVITSVQAAKPGEITLAIYTRVRSGMTYEEVVAIFGRLGTEISRVEMLGTVTVSYIWKNPGLFSSVSITFQNNAVVSMTQFGLR